MSDFGRTERALTKTLTTATNTQAELNAYYGPVLSAAMNNQFGAFGSIQKVRVANGDGTGWRTRTGRNAQINSILETDPIPASGAQTRVKMRAEFRINVAPVGITGLMQAESQPGPADVVNSLLDDEMANGMTDLLNYLEKCIFEQQAGVDFAKHVWSLKRIVDNTNAQAIFDKTRSGSGSDDYLDAAVKTDLSATPRPIEKDDIKALKGGIWDAVGEEPDAFFVTRALGDSLETLWESESRATPQEFEVNAGFVVRRCYGIPVIKSQFCNTDTIYGVNRKYLEWRYLTMAQVEQLGKTKDADEFFVKDYENLVCTNLRANGKIIGLQ